MDFIKNNKRSAHKQIVRILFWGGLLAAGIVVSSIFVFYQPYNEFLVKNYFGSDFYKYRDIDSLSKLWLNGYLALFFRFDKFGYLTPLLLPCILYILLFWKKLQNYEKALFSIFIFTVILIGINGFYNFRYAFTLFPFAIISIFWISHSCLDLLTKMRYSERTGIYSFFPLIVYGVIGSLLVFSVVSKKGDVSKNWKYAKHIQYDQSYRLNLLEYLYKLDLNTNKILVVNVNDFFYHTGLKSIKYDEIAQSADLKSLWSRINKHKIKYILADDSISIFQKYIPLSTILKDKSKIQIHKKTGSLSLYKVIDI